MLDTKKLKPKRILVTGAGGFIGSHVIESLLPLCAEVTALLHYDSRADWGCLEFLPPDRRTGIRVVSGDVTDAGFVMRLVKEYDTVLHLAALIAIPYSYHAPSSFFQVNTLGTVNVLEACREREIERVVTVSTSECYGTARYVPIDEEHPLQAQSPYSASKISADKAVESFHRSFSLPAVIVRPFNTFGPRQSARAVIPTIISQLFSDAETLQLGALSPVRDLTYAADTAEGIIAAACADGVEGETINLGVGKGISIGELAERIMALCGIKKEIVCSEERIRPDKSEVMQLISNNEKANRLLGWQPRHSLDEGLQKTIEFVRQNPLFFKTGKYTL